MLKRVGKEAGFDGRPYSIRHATARVVDGYDDNRRGLCGEVAELVLRKINDDPQTEVAQSGAAP